MDREGMLIRMKLQSASSSASKPTAVLPFRQKYFPVSPAAEQHQQHQQRRSPAAIARPLHVPSSVRCPPVLDPFGCSIVPSCPPFALSSGGGGGSGGEFSWLDQQVNNNSGETSSRKVAAKEMSRREVENWFHMHFRFRMESYQSLVYAVKQSAKDESVFSEDHLDKWTLKMKFRIRRSSPLKAALLACAARLGLEDDPDVMFCTDGFYGDALSGRIHNKNEVPNRLVQGTSTCRAMGLCNGSSVFVSRCTNNERENAVMQMQVDLLRSNDGDDSDEEDADFDDDGGGGGGGGGSGGSGGGSVRPRDSIASSLADNDFARRSDGADFAGFH